MRLAELEIPARAEFVFMARLVVASIADDRYELSEDRLDNLNLAVSEACVGAMDGRTDADGRSIAIKCFGADDRLDVVIDGHGVLFDVEQINADISATDIIAEGRRLEEELGLPLIRSLVDEFSVERTEEGNRLILTLFCERAEVL